MDTEEAEEATKEYMEYFETESALLIRRRYIQVTSMKFQLLDRNEFQGRTITNKEEKKRIFNKLIQEEESLITKYTNITPFERYMKLPDDWPKDSIEIYKRTTIVDKLIFNYLFLADYLRPFYGLRDLYPQYN